MSLYEQWKDRIENQTEDTFEDFWKAYSAAETKIYGGLLAQPGLSLSGTFGTLTESYGVDPVLFMGFLDGIQDSLEASFPIEGLDEASEIALKADPHKLYFNMLVAGADYLSSLPQWDNVLTLHERETLEKVYKKSKTVIKGDKVGRNDPCPCGSGKKYKHCCGRS
jgi:hypothetical protein